MKLSCFRNALKGSVDFPNTNSPLFSAAGNQLHSFMPCSGFGSDIPLAVYIAQNRRGTCPVTSAPMASRTGNAKAAPPIPFRKARRSIFRNVLIGNALILLFFQEQFAVHDESDHILHAVAVGFQLQSVLF